MNPDSPSPQPSPDDSDQGPEQPVDRNESAHDSQGGMTDPSQSVERPQAPYLGYTPGERNTTTFTFYAEVQPPSFSFEHDKQKCLLRLTGGDGKTELFRDNPTRYLVVEPDPETEEMRPVTKRGKPAYLYLCREEREQG